MPRRIQIRMACQRCRKKRAKCDGQVLCKRCAEAGEECVYDRSRRESKDDLRAEIDRLRRCNEENEQLLRAICSINDVEASNALIRTLVEGTKSRRAILQELAHLVPDVEHGRDSTFGPPSSDGLSRRPSPTKHCRESTSSPSAGALSASLTPSLVTTPVSLSPLPFDGPQREPRDAWTRAGWPVASVRSLLDALVIWDYLPFCLMCKDPFLRDYHSGSTRYCSPALVNALLALATRVVSENSAGTGSPGLGSKSRSRRFFDEAEAIIHDSHHSPTLPDIQAIGILSLYKISCGRDADSLALAGCFAARMAEYRPQECLAGVEAEEHAQVRATSYCGAVSLIRILLLTTGQVNNTLHDDSMPLERPSCRAEKPYDGPPSDSGMLADHALDAPSSPLRNVQLIPARVFQLTEWVYMASSATRGPSGQLDTGEVMTVYTKCLDWYQGFFSLLKGDGSDTPFVLFIHMYYQFSLLCLFRPIANLVLADSDVRPREICIQAAQSILALSQSYSRLFTLGRVSAFVPYFVCASGIAGLTMETAQPPPPGNMKTSVAAGPDEAGHDGFGTHDVPPSQAAAKLPMVAHANQLLAEMSSPHRLASPAEKILRGYNSGGGYI